MRSGSPEVGGGVDPLVPHSGESASRSADGADQPLEDAHCDGSGCAGGGTQPGGGGQYGAAARCSGVYRSSPISGAGSGASGSRSAPMPSASSWRSKPSLRTRWSK